MPSYGTSAATSEDDRAARSEDASQEPSAQGLELVREGGVHASFFERLAPFLAELVGCFVLTLTYLCNAMRPDPIWAVTSNAIMLVALTYAFGHVSGAHFNPAISISLWLCGRLRLDVAARYSLVQILGALFANAVRRLVSAEEINISPTPGFTGREVMAVEVCYTSMMCFVYLNCAASRGNNPSRDPNSFGGIAIGYCWIAGGYASATISGVVMNPAIAFSLQILEIVQANFRGWGVLYILFQVFGAALASGAYRIVRPKESLEGDGGSCSSHRRSEVANVTPLSAQVMAEFIGTFFLVLTKALNHLAASKAEFWSVGASMTAMVYALRGVSGGFFNPAITLAVCVSRPSLCSLTRGLMYVSAQILAALFSAVICAIVRGEAEISERSLGAHSIGEIAMAEMMLTLNLCFVALAASTLGPTESKTANNNYSGLAVGSAIVVGGLTIGTVSGNILNPATALAFSGLNGAAGHFASNFMDYIIYELAGSLLAALCFFLTFPGVYRKEPHLLNWRTAPEAALPS